MTASPRGGHTVHVLAAALVALAGCTAQIKPDEPKSVVALAIHPYETHEQCARLAPEDRLEYAFEATEPVSFDLRYREGRAVVAPIARESTRADAGVFIAQVARDYCLVWEAGAAGALVDYRIRLRPARR
jgi:hypothetical protein